MAAAAIVASVAALSPSSFGRSSWQDKLTRSVGTQQYHYLSNSVRGEKNNNLGRGNASAKQSRSLGPP